MIRNPEGIWINSEAFREEAAHFEQYGYYTEAPIGSYDYIDYWKEQYRRAKEGYSVGGVKITGHHYFYLNFCQIKRTDEEGDKKVLGFPAFWNGDYNYFWALHIARWGMGVKEYRGLDLDVKIRDLAGGHDMVVGKARRRGFSYKNSAVITCDYSTIRDIDNLIGAHDSKYLYPKGSMSMVKDNLAFLDEYTEFKKRRDYVDTKDHVRASYKQYINGQAVEKGYKSSIRALTYKDNPDAARGSDPYWVMMEEGGKWPNLISSYEATKPATEEGKKRTGMIVIYGTSSLDIDGDTQDFIDMFYNPEGHGLIPFENIWDEDNPTDSCSFFFPDYWGKEGFVDSGGNDDIDGAKGYEIELREKKRKKLSSSGLLGHIVERPFSPEEAFLVAVDNDFPTMELKARLNKVKEAEAYKKVGDVVELLFEEDGKKVVPKFDLEGRLSPHWFFDSGGTRAVDPKGAVVIYEHPIANSPFGYYKIGYDPYRQDQSTMDSRASILVYRGIDDLSGDGDKIVAEYYGRPETYDLADDICLKLAVYYNAEVMYENEVTHPKDYFKSRGMEKYLAIQPTHAINAAIKDSKVKRVFGMHMSDKIKDTAAKYYKKWLLEEHTFVDGEPVRNLDRIWSPGLLEETIRWNRKGNFDRVSAMFMLMFAIEENPAAMREAERSKEHIANKLAERYKRASNYGEKANAFARF